MGVLAATAEILVFLDADNADDPRLLPERVRPVRADEADLVLGSRLSGVIQPEAMPWHQSAWAKGWPPR